MNKNMTEGRPITLILQFAIPLLAGSLLQQTYNVIDAAIVGRILGTDALASVGASSSVQFLVLGFCMGSCAGFAIPVAKYYGANTYQRLRGCVFQGIILTTFIAAVLTAGCVILCPAILHFLSVPDKLYQDAYRYLVVIFWGLPFTLLYNYLSSILRAVGDSKTPFVFLVISTILNIIMDVFCIVVLEWGCAGAAIATVISQAISGILCLGFIMKKVTIFHLSAKECRMNLKELGILAYTGIPMGLQYSITAIGSMVMQSANNSLGTTYVSAFTAGMRIKQFSMCPFDAIATGVSVFCSQNYGAGKIERIRKGILEGLFAATVYGVVAGAVLILAGRMLSMIFVGAEAAAVLDASAKYLRFMGFFFWGVGVINICRLSIQGLGYSGRAIISGVIEMAARCTVSSVLVPMLGFTAICLADPAAWVFASVYISLMCMVCVRKIEKREQLEVLR